MSEVQHDLDRLGRTLRTYAQYSRKTPEEVLAKKGRDLTFALNRSFLGTRNPDNTPGHRTRIVNTARSIGWALGKVSPRAAELADELMGGQKSVVGHVAIDGDRMTIRTARIGKRGKRIIGGRRGRGGRAASLGEYKAESFDKLDGETVLNRRAVIVAIATMLRMRGSGSLAASWLFSRWKKGMRGNFSLEHVNSRAQVKLQGTAVFLGGESPSLVITSTMPGVGKFPAAVALALRDVERDTAQYAADKQAAAAKKAGLAR